MRLFTAIELPAPVLLRLDRLLSALRPEALIKWSPLDNLHVTIKFIGEWPEAQLEALHTALSSIPNQPAFELTIQKLGWFPDERSPRILWAGVDGADPLSQLAANTEDCLQKIGIKKDDRAFAPHLTLARMRNPVPLERLRDKVKQMQPLALGSFSVSQFALYQSQPGSNASIYRKLREYRFESALAAGTI